MKRNRVTWRLTDLNYDYILAEAERLGISANDVINIIVAQVTQCGMRCDSKVTAQSLQSS